MKQSKVVINACDLLIDRVQFKNAQFRLPDSYMSNHNDTLIIREATRLYIDTWVVPALRAIRNGDTQRLKDITKEM